MRQSKSHAASDTPILTKKQAAFRDAILAGFNPSEAYKKAFDAKNMSKRGISVHAAKLLKHEKVSLAIRLAVEEARKTNTLPQVLPAPNIHAQLTLQRRMEELAYIALFDPIDLFDELNHFKPIRDMPEHVRRCIDSFEVDPVSFVLKVKLHDKQRAIMNYSRLVGDIPPQAKTVTLQDSQSPLMRWNMLPTEERLLLREKISAVIREHMDKNPVVNHDRS